MSSIEEFIAAAGRLGIPCLVIGGGGANGAAHDADDDDDDAVSEVVAPFMAPAGSDAEEVNKLRAQVQKLTAALQEVQTTPTSTASGAVSAQVPAGNLGSMDGLSVEVLGLVDETLTKKLMRSGYETIGKLRVGFMDAKLADEGLKLKKDWLIEVGMKLLGASPSGAVTSAAETTAATNVSAPTATDAPAGHQDRPWLERLAAAKQKQHELDEGRAKLAAKQAEMAKVVKAKKDPTDLDDQIIAIEEGIMKDEARMVVLRWSLNLDFDSAISLDESLSRANLGPWMSSPQPRLAPK